MHLMTAFKRVGARLHMIEFTHSPIYSGFGQHGRVKKLACLLAVSLQSSKSARFGHILCIAAYRDNERQCESHRIGCGG